MSFPLWAKSALLSAALMILLAVALTVSAIGAMKSAVVSDIVRAQTRNLNVAGAFLERAVPGVIVDLDGDGDIARISLDEWPALATEAGADHAFIDSVGRLTGETATIFAYVPEERDFIRRTTNIVKPDGSRAVGTYLGEDSAAYAPVMEGRAFYGSAVILGRSYQTVYMPILARGSTVPANSRGVAGILYVGVADAVVGERMRELGVTLAVRASALVLVLIGLLAVLSRIALRPLREVAQQVARVLDGETLAVTVTRRDDLGEVQRSVVALSDEAERLATRAQMVDRAAQPMIYASAADDFRVTYANEAAAALFEGLVQHGASVPKTLLGAPLADLVPEDRKTAASLRDPSKLPQTVTLSYGDESVIVTASAVVSRNGSFAGTQLVLMSTTKRDAMAREFQTQVASLLTQVNASLDQLKDKTRTLEDTAADGRQNSSEAAALASETAQAVQTVAAAVEELNGSFTEVTERISQNAAMARDAAEITDSAAASAKALDAAGKRIREVISLIEDVAEQTNLLALNATIEASRAGEAGRGFAVVAAEVKSLAERAATATSEISGEVDRVNKVGTELLEAVANVQQAIQSVDEVSSSVAAAVTQQQTTTDEISRTVTGVAASAARVQHLSESVTESSSRTGEAADEVSRVTSDLYEVNRDLGTRANRFLDSVRKAA